MQTKLTNILQAQFNKTIEDCTNEELYTGLLMLVYNSSFVQSSIVLLN